MTQLEPNSADSYLHEEPDGVEEQPEQVSKHRPHQQQPIPKTIPQTIPQRVVEDKNSKKKVVDNMTPSQTPEPPWVHLSRKLCTKFIEEHIGEICICFTHKTDKLVRLVVLEDLIVICMCSKAFVCFFGFGWYFDNFRVLITGN